VKVFDVAAFLECAEARMILRDLLAVLQRTSATRRQRRAAARVGHGARWRGAIARESAEGVWWWNGRMKKAGTKNNPMPVSADAAKRNQKIAATRFDG
jgi:hypothetical protein